MISSRIPSVLSALAVRLGACLLLLAGTAPEAAAQEMVVRFRPEAARAAGGAARLARARGLETSGARELLVPGAVLLPSGLPDKAVRQLMNDPQVLYVERTRPMALCDTLPADPLFIHQYQLRNTGQGDPAGTPGSDIRASSAWDVTTGSADLILAVIDTGVDLAHPDLAPRIWTNPGEIPGNGLDDDGNGFIDDVHGWDFASGSNNMTPSSGHGTFVAGMAAAATGNGIGVAGADWNCRIMSVNVFPPGEPSTDVLVADGILYAARNGARVINLSLGGTDTSRILEDAVTEALGLGALIVAAAGNNNFNTDAHPFYPANLPYRGVVAVGGSTNRDAPIYNYGAFSVDLAAPADRVYSTRQGGAYGIGSGTSYAAPLAAAAATLMLSVDREATPALIHGRLSGTVRAAPGLEGRNLRGGVLDLGTLVRVQDQIPPAPVTDLAVDKTGWNGAVLRFTAVGDDGTEGRAASYELRVTSAPLSADGFDRAPRTTARVHPAPAGHVEHILVRDLEPEVTYWFALRAVDDAGLQGPVSNWVTATLPPASGVLFEDLCDFPSPVWTAAGFTLAPGDSHTGSLSWQDSPGAAYTTGTTSMLESAPFDLSGTTRPRLTYYLKWLFPNAVDRHDGFLVQASTDGGSTWRTLRRHVMNSSPMRRQSVPLDAFAGQAQVRLRFLFFSGDNALVDDGVYLDDIRIQELGEAVVEEPEVLLEPVDFFGQVPEAPEIVISGGWTTSSKSQAPRLEGFAGLSAASGTAGAVVTYAPFLTAAGSYEVLTTWSGNRSAAGVGYEIRSTTGVTTLRIDQTPDRANRWVSLGTYHFDYGQTSSGLVAIRAEDATSGDVQADAVLFRYADLEPVPPPSPAAGCPELWQLYH